MRDPNYTSIGVLYPREGGMQPTTIRWSRRWRDVGELSLEVPVDDLTIYLSSPGNHIVVEDLEQGTVEGVYIITEVEARFGIVRYRHDTASMFNAVYVAGQGVGTLRNLMLRSDAEGITAVGRIERFVDAREVEYNNYDALRARGDQELKQATFLPNIEVRQEYAYETRTAVDTMSVRALHASVWLARRVVLPPPGTRIASIPGLINITNSEYDKQTGMASSVMSGYVTRHLTNPADPARKVPIVTVAQDQPPLPAVSHNGRFEAVLEALQTIGRLADAGFELAGSSSGLEFRVLPRRDLGMRIWTDDLRIGVPGRDYRYDWDIGHSVTVEVVQLQQQVKSIIHEVSVTLRPGEPDRYVIALGEFTSFEAQAFAESILRRLATVRSMTRT